MDTWTERAPRGQGKTLRNRVWLAALLMLGCGDDDSSLDGAQGGDGGGLVDGGGDRDGGMGVDAPLPDAFPPFGAELYVATDGSDDNPGTLEQPFATLERARTAVRDLKASSGLPEGGVGIWLRGGLYLRESTFELGAEDSGEAGKPVVYQSYGGETARLAGGKRLEPGWFQPVASGSPAYDRLDDSARGNVLAVALPDHGLTDYGELRVRGFNDGGLAALELFVDGQPMTLARWPDADEHDPPATAADATIVLRGNPVPDVTGTYDAFSTSDGVNAYRRAGLVGDKQYYLYRSTWDWEGSTFTAWFLTTQTSGYPANTDPWWNRYSEGLGEMAAVAESGATGTPTTRDPEAITHGFVAIDRAVGDTSFTYTSDRPSRWSTADAIWLHGYWKYMWADLHVPVGSVDTSTQTITLPEAPGYGIADGQPYYAENLLEEITRPGEWYVDRGDGTLFLWPPEGFATAEVLVSTFADALVRMNETSHVLLRDLTLEVTRGPLVQIQGGSNNTLLHCELLGAGNTAAEISGTHNGLERCHIRDSGDAGVAMWGGDRASLTRGENFVRNCDIERFGRWSWTYRPGVSLSGCGHVVAHNHLHGAPHAAILFGGNEHLIEVNEIDGVCAFSSDAGAIYTGRDWGYRGNEVRYNFIHHVASAFEGLGVHGVYLDDCVSGIHVFGNVLYEISGLAVLNGGGRDNIIENNVMARSGDAMMGDNRGLLWITNIPGDSWNLLERLTNDGIQYLQEPWASAYPLLAAIPNDWATISDPESLWFYPQGCVFSRNLGFDNGSFMVESIWAGTGVFDKYAEIADNLEDQDPRFVDEDNLDLTLAVDSPAWSVPGFQPIPFDQIGIQP